MRLYTFRYIRNCSYASIYHCYVRFMANSVVCWKTWHTVHRVCF